MTTVEQTQVLPTGTWNGDPVHSDIGFSVEYMAGTFSGSFSKFAAQLVDGKLSGSAEVSSIQVKDPNLEAHLQSPEFFDAERFPQLTFGSQSISRDGNRLKGDGEITIRGETRPLQLTGTVSDPITDPWGNERFGVKLEGTVDRTEFGLNWNNPLPSGEPALSNQVKLFADLQLVKAAG
jgi:polyisoprenoid-binding protein YceI